MARRGSTLLPFHLYLLLLTILTPNPSSSAVEDDVKCLQGFQKSLSDPQGTLSSWTFANTSVGSICSLSGVSCWNDRENRVLRLQLPSMSLSGPIPSSLQFCPSMTHLDLSNNRLSGPISSSICDWLPYLVTLDLSNNQLSGPIPPDLSNCRYLNTLLLGENSLSGAIPSSLSGLDRLTSFSVASNRLSGPIPSSFASDFSSSSFDGNSGLCGRPLGKCGGNGGLGRTGLIIILAAGVFGAAASLLFAFGLWWWFFRSRKKGGNGEGWVERLRSHRYAQVSLFQKPIVKVRLADLLAATNDFDAGNVVDCGGSVLGVCYKAVLPDGSALAVKRLRSSSIGVSEKLFRAEMVRLGQLRHPNLVPLLGFCIAAEDERLLVYKHMPNSSLASIIHRSGRAGAALDWPGRLRIGIGAARGLAWLHHGCQPPFLHQSMSSSAVLLDEDYEARITDFGIARLSRWGAAESNGVGDAGAVSNALIDGDFGGDLGYVPPEYASNPVSTAKGDVYAFGVVLLELATGQKPLEVTGNADEGLRGIWLIGSTGSLGAVGVLRGKGYDDQILQFLEVARGCVASMPRERHSMYQVYTSLKSISDGHGLSDQYDEFPLKFGKNDPDLQE
ncbi:putative inactive receptor kinase [Acorus calamus]|uniref:Inactive receptor kinase n=1 Tax=Acorus calamus TaxID=4465 RepID=A0AAV9DCG1_ACOCL|nr:putative inactive receptor kinase [Acorus calamus]